jgi:hypothetical protein
LQALPAQELKGLGTTAPKRGNATLATYWSHEVIAIDLRSLAFISKGKALPMDVVNSFTIASMKAMLPNTSYVF